MSYHTGIGEFIILEYLDFFHVLPDTAGTQLLPVSGVYKSAFKMWQELDSLKNVNELIRYGIISEDTENKTIALHPLIQEVAIAETIPTVSDWHRRIHHP